jgi:hypothetical protein
MEAEKCKICKQDHRSDYRVFSEMFQRYMTDPEFVTALNTGAAFAVPNYLTAIELPF